MMLGFWSAGSGAHYRRRENAKKRLRKNTQLNIQGP